MSRADNGTQQATSDDRDPIVAAMRRGAGLPVLSALDQALDERARANVADDHEREVLTQVCEEIDSWLDDIEESTRTKLETCERSPLESRILRFLEDHLTPRRAALDDVREHADAEATTEAWSILLDELEELHVLRARMNHVKRATAHLREVARLLEDVPDDEAGRSAMERMSEIEALAATHDDPPRWAEAAREIESLCLEHVRLEPETPEITLQPSGSPTPRDPEPSPTPTANSAETSPGDHHDQQDDQTDRTHPTTNGHSENGVASLNDAAAGEAISSPPDNATPSPQSIRGTRPRPRRTRASEPCEGEAAGPEVLAEWEAHDGIDDEFRHGPFWAPIATGEVTAPGHDAEELLAHAAEVEIDLVDIELPRILAVPAGGSPKALRERIAKRVLGITKHHPKQPARRTMLDYVVGKLPKRYRETTEGLALIESIAYALCKDEPWSAPDVGYFGTVKRMVRLELERTPAIDLTQLTTSLLGDDPDARSMIDLAARELATEDPSVTHHPDGVLVRALAAREDPDALYALRNNLEHRLGLERAKTLMNTLISTGGEKG